MAIELTIDKRSHDLGGGFVVGRVLPYRRRRMVGPFIFFDHLGPLELAPGVPRELDVRPHPHIGLATVTYLFSGAITHRDSLGYEQEIEPGAVNWMVAGNGITHSERLEYARAHGAHMHGIQAWVALPEEAEETTPAFYHHPADTLPTWQEAGVSGRLVAGEMEGIAAPTKTHSPLFYQHVEIAAGARHRVNDAYSERAVYVVTGHLQVDGRSVSAGQLVVLKTSGDVLLQADTSAVVMLLGGEPVGERFLLWNFVSSRRERLEEAKLDWQTGRMKLPVGDDQEFIPLPERWSQTAIK